MKGLSKKQEELLLEIEKMKLQGIDPTVTTLARKMNLAGNTVRNRVFELVNKGYVKYITPVQGMSRYKCSKRIIVLKPLLMNNIESYSIIGRKIDIEDFS
jgi:hypothetical protein